MARKHLYCSFCGKAQHEVLKLIAGPTVFICDECVDLCRDIITEEKRQAAKASGIVAADDQLARELWWPHHRSRTRSIALAALDRGSTGHVTLDFEDFVHLVDRVRSQVNTTKSE